MNTLDTASAGLSEVKAAILMTRMRETATGVLWLPERRTSHSADIYQRRLQSIFLYRGPALHGTLQQVARLVHLMDVAHPRGYVGFLYLHLTRLTVLQFRQAISSAAARGRLGVDFSVTDKGVSFLSPRMDGETKRFDLDFGQMPFLGAVLDVLHNSLGYEAVRGLLAPVLGAQTGSAAQVGKDLRKALADWLHPRLEPEHLQKQRAAIRAYLMHRDLTESEKIGPEEVRDFWCDYGSRFGDATPQGPMAEFLCKIDTSVDGFRLLDHACASVLRYRDALSMAQSEQNIETADDAALTRAWSAQDPQPNSEETAGGITSIEVVEERFSALAELVNPPANAVKWLSGTTVDFLWTGFGAASEECRGLAKISRKALFRDGDPTFVHFRTVLLVQAFASLQNLVKGKTITRDDMAKVVRADYAEKLARYRDIRSDLDRTMRAAAWMLIKHGEMTGAILAARVAPQEVKTTLLTEWGQDAGKPTAVELLAEALEQKGSPLVRVLDREGFAKVNRTGFRWSEEPDTLKGTVAALLAGADHIAALAKQCKEFTDWAEHADLDRLYAEDAERVCTRLVEMYGADPENIGEVNSSGARRA